VIGPGTRLGPYEIVAPDGNFLVVVRNEGDSTPDHIYVLLGWRRKLMSHSK